MKQYKSAYVLMKAMPFHNGHKYLIDTAISQSEKVTVVVGSLSTEPIPGTVRFAWVVEQYRTNPNVMVKHCCEELPQYPAEDPEHFWDKWVDVVKRYCPDDLDVIFTSESYGYTYAEKLGIQHHIVDIKRNIIPISGTEIRRNPFGYWHYIPDHVKPYFVKRIAIMGAESCGKSTLTKNLAKIYNTNYVEEYGRRLYENNNGSLTETDFISISQGRQLIEDAMVDQSNKLLFCDTEDLTTLMFYDMYFPNYDPKRVKNYLVNTVNQHTKYDLYILLKPDCEALQDGTRNFLSSRVEHYENLKREMTKRKYNFIEVGGNYINRQLVAEKTIKEQFGL